MGKKGKKWVLVKRLAALTLCVLWIAAMPVFAVGNDTAYSAEEECLEEAFPEAENRPETEETPETEEMPEAEETPEVEEPPAVENPPEAENPSKPEETPKAENTPDGEETPDAEETPDGEETPEAEETPDAEEIPDAEENRNAGEDALGDAVHRPGCDESCTGEACECSCHSESTDTADTVESSLLDRLLAAESCQAQFALLQAEENGPAVLALTAEDLDRVRARTEALPDDGWQGDVLEVLDMLRGLLEGDADKDAAVLATATVTSLPQNAVVAYAYRRASDSGWTWGGEYTGGFDITYSSSYGTEEVFYVFFVKPAENYLLTQFSVVNAASGSTSYDLYSIDCTSSRINGYPDFAALVAQAKAQGYLGFNGYRSSAAGNVTLNQYFTGQRPALGVSAVAEPDRDVKPGDTVRFTVTLTPEAVSGSTVQSFQLTALTVNGVTYTDVPLTRNGDGSYTAAVDYTATEADWISGDITLNAEGNVTYEYILPVTDRNNNGSKITTTATVTSSGAAAVSLAEDYGVGYVLRFEPQDVQPPAGIPQPPVDNGRYFEGSAVTVKDYDGTAVDDPENGGTWTFDGWYREEQGPYGAGKNLNMPKGGLLLTGVWRFEKYPTVTVTVRKLVTGNLGDTNRAFAFRVTGNTYENAVESDGSFTLKHRQEKTVTVNRGDTLTISEDCGDYQASYQTDGAEIAGSTVTLTVTEDCEVVFRNRKEVPLDTGVTLDWAPYALLLALAGAGAGALRRRKD